MNRKSIDTAIILLLCGTLLAFLGVEFFLNLTPPISRDALVHHLAVPKLWLRHGGFYETPWADYSYYPMYVNLLYLVCLYFQNDLAPKFIHLGFALATGGLIFAYLRHRFDGRWGLLGMVIFITTPIVVRLSTSAYIDLGMTFFTTASLLAFIRWQDLGYGPMKWFWISSVCMGLAVGSKYNALIALVIMMLILMFTYVRDTHQQAAALKYGMLFGVVATLAASPWYIKNYVLTGNPFYPLFNSLVQSLHHQPIREVVHEQAMQNAGQISFFRMREIMYGETFWETLLIPIRMFFQGKDNSYQYFQGVLNPILIVFWPFAFLNGKEKKDRFIFSFFSVFFIFIAYFLTRKQVRYLLPVLPVLAILAVVGIKSLNDRLNENTFFAVLKFHTKAAHMFAVLLFASVILLLSLNGLYLKQRVDIIKPFASVFGHEPREVFLRQHLKHYPAVEYVNAHLPEDAVVFTMFLGRRGYYLERPYKNEPSFGMNTLKQMVERSADIQKFIEYVRSMNVTHILMRTDLVDKYLNDNFSKQEILRFVNVVNQCWKKIYDRDGYVIWDVRISL